MAFSQTLQRQDHLTRLLGVQERQQIGHKNLTECRSKHRFHLTYKSTWRRKKEMVSGNKKIHLFWGFIDVDG